MRKSILFRLVCELISICSLLCSQALLSTAGVEAWQCTESISKGQLPVGGNLQQPADVINVTTALQPGQCHTWVIPSSAQLEAGCSGPRSDRYLYVEFWKQAPAGSDASAAASSSGAGLQPVLVDDAPPSGLFVLAAQRDTPSVSRDGRTVLFSPALHGSSGGPSQGGGTFTDRAASLYLRPYHRLMLPVGDMSEPSSDDTGGRSGEGSDSDPGSWHMLISNLNTHGVVLPGYMLRATCVSIAGAGAQLPCATPLPDAPECLGRGSCDMYAQASSVLGSRYCNCQAGWGGSGCARRLTPLPADGSQLRLSLAPGAWAYFELQLPAATANTSTTNSDGGGLGPSADTDLELLVELERGQGGAPLMFLKPFAPFTSDRGEPFMDVETSDMDKYADMRSWWLKQDKHFLLQRLQVPPHALTRRWYVAVYNSDINNSSVSANGTRGVPITLRATVTDLRSAPLRCPFNCSGAGKCVDPLDDSGAPPKQPLLLQQPASDPSSLAGQPNGTSGALAATSPAEMPSADPRQEGFACLCNPGLGGALCEGRQWTLNIARIDSQQLGPLTLEPRGWDYFLLTVDPDYSAPALGVRWVIDSSDPTTSSGRLATYTNAYITVEPGRYPRQMPASSGAIARAALNDLPKPYTALLGGDGNSVPLALRGMDPGGLYVLAVFNADEEVSAPFTYSLALYRAPAWNVQNPYVSIILGITAAVVLSLVMAVAKKLMHRYSARRWHAAGGAARDALAAGAGGAGERGGAGGGLAHAVPRGVPRVVYRNFPCYAWEAGTGGVVQDLEAGQVVTPAAGGALPAPLPTQAPAAGSGSNDDDAPCCTICLCEYVVGERMRRLPCGHEFHRACVDKWMQQHDTCPICRQPLWPGALVVVQRSGSSGGGGGGALPPVVAGDDVPPTPPLHWVRRGGTDLRQAVRSRMPVQLFHLVFPSAVSSGQPRMLPVGEEAPHTAAAAAQAGSGSGSNGGAAASAGAGAAASVPRTPTPACEGVAGHAGGALPLQGSSELRRGEPVVEMVDVSAPPAGRGGYSSGADAGGSNGNGSSDVGSNRSEGSHPGSRSVPLAGMPPPVMSVAGTVPPLAPSGTRQQQPMPPPGSGG